MGALGVVLEAPRKLDRTIKQRVGTILISVVLYQLVRYIWPSVSPTAASACTVMAAVLWLIANTTATEVLLSSEDKPILITGCDTGFGHWLAWRLDKLGGVVFAGCLDANGAGAQKLREDCSNRLYIIQLDITKEDQVEHAFEFVQKTLRDKKLPPLWGLVNNAAINARGDLEITSMDYIRRVTDVNILGTIMVTKMFLPMIRKRQGRVVNFSSVQGRAAMCLNGIYSCSKFAIDAFSAILRQEMRRFGVKVVIVEPSNFGGATEGLNFANIEKMMDNYWANMSENVRETYGRDYVYSFLSSAKDVAPTTSLNVYRVLDAAVEGVLGARPSTRYMVPGGRGWVDLYWARAVLYPYIPDWLMDQFQVRDMIGFPLPASLLGQ